MTFQLLGRRVAVNQRPINYDDLKLCMSKRDLWSDTLMKDYAHENFFLVSQLVSQLSIRGKVANKCKKTINLHEHTKQAQKFYKT